MKKICRFLLSLIETNLVQWLNIFNKGLNAKQIKADVCKIHFPFWVFFFHMQLLKIRLLNLNAEKQALHILADKNNHWRRNDWKRPWNRKQWLLGEFKRNSRRSERFTRRVTVLHQYFNMSKLGARWVPLLLTVDHKGVWIVISQQRLKIGAIKNISSFCQKSRLLFWICREVIFSDYLQNGKTITAKYYASLLDNSEQKIKAKRPDLSTKKVLFGRIMPCFQVYHCDGNTALTTTTSNRTCILFTKPVLIWFFAFAHFEKMLIINVC